MISRRKISINTCISIGSDRFFIFALVSLNFCMFILIGNVRFLSSWRTVFLWMDTVSANHSTPRENAWFLASNYCDFEVSYTPRYCFPDARSFAVHQVPMARVLFYKRELDSAPFQFLYCLQRPAQQRHIPWSKQSSCLFAFLCLRLELNHHLNWKRIWEWKLSFLIRSQPFNSRLFIIRGSSAKYILFLHPRKMHLFEKERLLLNTNAVCIQRGGVWRDVWISDSICWISLPARCWQSDARAMQEIIDGIHRGMNIRRRQVRFVVCLKSKYKAPCWLLAIRSCNVSSRKKSLMNRVMNAHHKASVQLWSFQQQTSTFRLSDHHHPLKAVRSLLTRIHGGSKPIADTAGSQASDVIRMLIKVCFLNRTTRFAKQQSGGSRLETYDRYASEPRGDCAQSEHSAAIRFK